MIGNTPNISQKIYCYGCDDYESGFITSLKNISNNDITQLEDIDLEIEILSKYFKVDGKSPKMRYISSLRKEFDGKDLELVFITFENLKKNGLILIDGNSSHISKTGINYYHKNIQA